MAGVYSSWRRWLAEVRSHDLGFKSKLQLGRAALLGAANERQQARYLISMLCRGVDLRGVTVEDLGLDKARSHWHSNSGGPNLDLVLKTLELSAFDSALDLGCGKGGALITLAHYPFQRVDGVEISRDLARIANDNLRRFGVVRSSIICCDAADFLDLDRYTFLYMYNPFPEVVMKTVLENIRLSLARQPRRLMFVYKNPVFSELVARSGLREVRDFNHTSPPFRLYLAEPIANQSKTTPFR